MPPVARAAAPLAQVIPPLILGTATFNTQYHPSPDLNLSLPILARALDLGVAALDTSPYYGPSERILGAALRALAPERASLFLITKAGRVGPSSFDYSPAHVEHSVRRSLARLSTPYLDLVHCHDVEFVSPGEVLAAIRELRRLRDREGLLRYVGISGYPLPVLADLAELILAETGEAIDAVQSYSHFCVQNDALGAADLLDRFRRAGVSVVTNASMLSMGLLTTRGVDAGPQASWHPAPRPLRRKCTEIGAFARGNGEKLEDLSLRWAMGAWASRGASLGTSATMDVRASRAAAEANNTTRPRMGVSVMGVTNAAELDETWRAWNDVARVAEIQAKGADVELDAQDRVIVHRAENIRRIVENDMWPALGEWRNHSWDSPQPGFVNERREFGVLPEDFDEPVAETQQATEPSVLPHAIDEQPALKPALGAVA
jgi:aryl-alcohol dehydrogenase-like predicted oxidoreductase